MYTFLLDGNQQQKQIAMIRDEIDDISVSSELGGGEEGVDYFLSDERILSRMGSVEESLPGNPAQVAIRLFTAASLLDTLATNQAYVLKKQRTLEQDTDGPAVAASIRAHAKSLRERAAAIPDDDDPSGGRPRVNRPASAGIAVRTVF